MDPEQVPGTSVHGTQSPRAFLLCPNCKLPASHLDQRYCGQCGHSLFQSARFREDPKRRSLLALTSFLVVAALLVLWQFTAGSNAAPSLAGIQVGDTGNQVVRVLGHPQKVPTQVYWQGADGKSHGMELWEYDVGRAALGGMAGLTVTMIDGHVQEVGALAPRYRTSDGLHVGDKLDKAKGLYGTGIEEDSIEGLMPTKFIKAGVVVKVISMRGDPSVLAVGIESPDQVDLSGAIPQQGPSAHDPHAKHPPLQQGQSAPPAGSYF